LQVNRLKAGRRFELNHQAKQCEVVALRIAGPASENAVNAVSLLDFPRGGPFPCACGFELN
jgi:hypothetical protein